VLLDGEGEVQARRDGLPASLEGDDEWGEFERFDRREVFGEMVLWSRSTRL
jgi:hypothetical protein